MFRLNALLAPTLTATLVCGCYKAPKLSGSDQVYDHNVEATALKDNRFAELEWRNVDNYMWAQIGYDQAPGCALGVAQNGVITYLKGYGKAQIGGENWDVNTMGAVGSVSKTFTAAAALRMHELGMLDVNRTVGHYLSTSNAGIRRTPIYDLMAHSSGIGGGTQNAAVKPEWEDGSDAAACDDSWTSGCTAVSQTLASPRAAFRRYDAAETVVQLAKGDPGAGVPDQGVYSNVGYSVLGAIIDSVSPYEAFIWEHIGQYTGDSLDPGNLLSLALTHSWRDRDIRHRAVGYEPYGYTFRELEAFDPRSTKGIEGWEGPSGGWAMTIGDLTRFAIALNDERIVGRAMLQAMRYPFTDIAGFTNSDYGYGTLIGNNIDPPYWHGGDIGGHSAVWSHWPAAGGQPSLTITLMCNRNDIGGAALRGHSINLRATVRTTSPTRTPRANPAPVGYRVNGHTYQLGHRRAYQSEPSNIFAPISQLAAPLEITTRLGLAGLGITIGQDGDRLANTMATWRDPWFEARVASVPLQTTIGEIVVHDMFLRGAVTSLGLQLSDVSLTGTIDMREVSETVGMSAQELCTTSSGNWRCTPCSGGIHYCVTVTYEGLDGTD